MIRVDPEGDRTSDGDDPPASRLAQPPYVIVSRDAAERARTLVERREADLANRFLEFADLDVKIAEREGQLVRMTRDLRVAAADLARCRSRFLACLPLAAAVGFGLGWLIFG